MPVSTDGTLDTGVERHDIGVRVDHDSSVTATCVRERTGDRLANGLPRARLSATLDGDADEAWLRVETAPVAHLATGAEPLDDEFVSRQLDSKIQP